jgi:hypothetical protein
MPLPSASLLWEMNRESESQLLPILVPRSAECDLDSLQRYLLVLKRHARVLQPGYNTGSSSQHRFYSVEVFESYVWVPGAEMQGVVVVTPFAGQVGESFHRSQTLEGIAEAREVFGKEQPVRFVVDLFGNFKYIEERSDSSCEDVFLVVLGKIDVAQPVEVSSVNPVSQLARKAEQGQATWASDGL